MTASWLVTLACPRCGAPGQFVEAQLIAICAYCGHVISTHRAVVASQAQLAFAEARSFVVPTLADVRRLELQDRKLAAQAAGDATTLHAATLELAALDAIDSGLPADEVARWARWTAAVEQVATFGGVALITPRHEELARDPAGYTRSLLDQLTAMYREIYAALPVDLATAIPAEVAATDALLASLASWWLYVPLAAFEAALVTLGQRPIHRHGAALPCRTCGAPICAAALAALACSYCRAALEVRRHVWLEGLVRTAALARASTLVPRDRAYAALVMLTHAAEVPGNHPLPDHLIAAYLAALEDVAPHALAEIARFVRPHHGLGPAALAVIERVLAVLDVAGPPAPPPGFVALPPSEAWARAMARNWRRLLSAARVPPDQLGLVAVNQLLPALAGGYLPDPGDAARFLASLELPRASIRAAIALHATGEAEPAKRGFWEATLAALT